METPSEIKSSSGGLMQSNGQKEFHTRMFEGFRRQRSARRLRHEAEVRVFEGSVGDIEVIRQKLGLKPVQMAELLRVHPSAWTRWTRTKRIPPYIYRMLEWYLELQAWRTQGRQVMAPGHQLAELPPASRAFLKEGFETSEVQSSEFRFSEVQSSEALPFKRLFWALILSQGFLALALLGLFFTLRT